MQNESEMEMRSSIAEIFTQHKSQCRRYPKDLQRRIVTHVASERSRGVKVRSAAEALGLPYPTLRRWLQNAESNGFRSVAVKSSVSGDETATSLCVVTPHGYRVEGLDREDVAFLLRSLA